MATSHNYVIPSLVLFSMTCVSNSYGHIAQISIERIIRCAENATSSITALNLYNPGGGFRLTKK